MYKNIFITNGGTFCSPNLAISPSILNLSKQTIRSTRSLLPSFTCGLIILWQFYCFAVVADPNDRHRGVHKRTQLFICQIWFLMHFCTFPKANLITWATYSVHGSWASMIDAQSPWLPQITHTHTQIGICPEWLNSLVLSLVLEQNKNRKSLWFVSDTQGSSSSSSHTMIMKPEQVWLSFHAWVATVI